MKNLSPLRVVALAFSVLGMVVGVMLMRAGLTREFEVKRDYVFTVISPSTDMTGPGPLQNTRVHQKTLDC